MKPLHWIILILVVSASAWIILNTASIDPRYEERIDLNWKFLLDDDSTFSEIDYDDGDWEVVSLPHDWMIAQPVAKDNPSGNAGGYYPGGVGWYRKQLDLSSFSEKEQFYLVFDGVYMDAEVWVNGALAGVHRYGYIGFHLDITDLIRFDTVNVVAVRSDCSRMPVDRWYSGAGIYRHVKLIATEKFHLPVHHSRISTTLDGSNSMATASITLTNNDRRDKRFKIRTDLIAPDGSRVNSATLSQTIDRKSSDEVLLEIPVPDPVTWSVDHPELYEVHTYLYHKKRIRDNAITRFGFRDAQFSPDSGFILNGEKILLKGVCIHHDGGSLGAAVPDATWAYRLKALKELGVNAVRLAHNPHAPEVLDLCDELGILVIGEMYDKWEMIWQDAAQDFGFSEHYKKDLAYYIRRDINHPSIIAWSVGNETIEQREDPVLGVQLYTELAAIAKQTDSTRSITCGLHPGYPDRGDQIPSDYIHIEPLVSYNYRTDSFAVWHERYPEMTWLASETKSTHENRRSNFEEISYMDNSWQYMDPFVAGQFIWAGIDYLGESPGWPAKGFDKGLLKTNAEIKPFSFYTQSIYSEEPMVKITVVDQQTIDSLNNHNNWQNRWAGAPVVRHWNFDQAGDSLRLVIFTNCQEVELIVNDSLLNYHFRSNFNDGVIKTPVVYEPGMISAVGYYTDVSGTKIKVVDSILTALEASMIKMDPDKTEMLADGKDVVHIRTSVTDSIGTLHPKANHLINYEVRGPAEIKVIDNGDLTDHTPYQATRKRVHQGTQLLIIQSTLEPGDLTIRASASGLKPASVKVTSKPPENKTSKPTL